MDRRLRRRLWLRLLVRRVVSLRRPLEFFLLGRTPPRHLAPRTPTDLALWSGAKLKDAKKLQLPAERAAKYVENLAASLERMHEAVRTEGERRRRQQAIRESGKEGNLRFHVGDFVMVAAKDNQTNVQRHNKVQVK